MVDIAHLKSLQGKRILVLTPRFPYPPIGGDRLRIYNICKELSEYCSITLLSLCDSIEDIDRRLTDDVFDEVHCVYLPKWKSYLGALLAVPCLRPLQVGYYRSKAFREQIHLLAKEHDALLAHLIRTGDAACGITHIPKFLEMTDAISLNYKRVSELSKKRSFLESVYRFESTRLRGYEKQCLSKYEVVTLVSDIDREFLLEGEENENVLVCSNGVNLDLFPFEIRKPSVSVAVFIGNITSAQNLDACYHFAEDILPPLHERLGVRFKIVGKICETDASNLKSYPNVEVTGGVDSISKTVEGDSVGVCPMRIGAGVQNKVLEYMALGLPTITSSLGYQGFAAVPNEDILIADTVDEYIAHFEQLHADHKFYAQLAQSARKYVESNHNWSAQLNPMVRKIAATLAESS